MRRLPILVLVAGAALAAPFAQAEPPVITPAPSQDLVDPSTCAFPVSVHYTVNGETSKTFSSGRVIVTGPLAAQFSANGKSVTVNISGPVMITPNSDGSVTISGRGVGAGPMTTPNGLTLGYAAGPVTINPQNGIATLEHGTLRLDICAALAL